MAGDDRNRIKYALYSPTSEALQPLFASLRSTSTRVLAADCTKVMRGHLFCPGCFTALTRTPRDKLVFSNGRRVCFAHLPANRDTPCDLRSIKPEGKLYLNEEEATRAIENDELVIVNAFLETQPETPNNSGEYDQTPVEDMMGPEADVPIARHRGKTFKLPTRVATVANICRRFDENLYRYYFFPGANSAVRLIDALSSVSLVQEPTSVPTLYFGKIVSSRNAGISPKPTNIRMTKLLCNPQVKDFSIKVQDHIQAEKGISDLSVGRFVLFWGVISVSGIGLCAPQLKWGEFSLLPSKYEHLLPHPDA